MRHLSQVLEQKQIELESVRREIEALHFCDSSARRGRGLDRTWAGFACLTVSEA